MPIATRTFRVFVSSTFEDLKAERDALQRDVFPRLRKLCEANGARFQAIDLRWGVRDEAALDQQTMQICLREIERCQQTGIKPNFIVLLGERYGWRPLPARIEAAEFEEVRGRVTDAGKRLIDDWYERDDNAVPPEYLLKPRTGEFADKDRWEEMEQSLHRILREAARDAGLAPEALIKYEASATHQEILKGLGQSEADRRHVFAFFREVAEGAAEDAELAALKEDLRQKLPGENVRRFQIGEVEKLCTDVEDALRKVILDETSRFTSRDGLDLEIEAHDRFAADRCRIFVGRKDALTAIADYLNGPERRPLVLHGASGSGKSALMAKASERYAGQGRLIRRFIGASPESTRGHALLTNLCKQIAPGETPVDYYQLEKAFQQRLAAVTAEQPLVLLIDAIDHLAASDPARAIAWLPVELPPHVKVIVSTTDDEARLPAGLPVHLERMTTQEGGLALGELLRETRRTLQPWQRELVQAHFERCGLPLYLKLAAAESRLWKSFSLPEACTLGEGIAGVLDTLFDRLASNTNHGPVLVERSLGYLAAARYGLTEDEILDVLTADDTVWIDFNHRKHHDLSEHRLPVVVWSRLSLDLEPYLSERAAPGGTVISFYHRQLAENVAQRFLLDGERTARHSSLANYFGKQSHWIARDIMRANERKVSELVQHEIGANALGNLETTLTDLDFVGAKCAADLTLDLVNDYREAWSAFTNAREKHGQGPQGQPRLPHNEIGFRTRSFEDFFRNGAHLFRRAPVRVYQEAINWLSGSAVSDAARRLLKASAFPPTPWLRLVSEREAAEMAGPVCACTFLDDSQHVIAASQSGQVWAWDCKSGRVSWRFDRRPEGRLIRALVISPNGRILAAACGPGKPPVSLYGNEPMVQGSRLSMSEWNGMIQIWNLDGSGRAPIPVGDWVYSLCWLDDARLLAAGGAPSGSDQGGQIFISSLPESRSDWVRGLSGDHPFIWIAGTASDDSRSPVIGRTLSEEGLVQEFSLKPSGEGQLLPIGRLPGVRWIPLAIGTSPDSCVFVCGDHLFRATFTSSPGSRASDLVVKLIRRPRSESLVGLIVGQLPWLKRLWRARKETVTCLACSPDSETIALGLREGDLLLVRPSRVRSSARVRVGNAPLSSVAVSPDGRFAAAGNAAGTLSVVDTKTSKVIMTTGEGDLVPAERCIIFQHGCAAIRKGTIQFQGKSHDAPWSVLLEDKDASVQCFDLASPLLLVVLVPEIQYPPHSHRVSVVVINAATAEKLFTFQIDRLAEDSEFRCSWDRRRLLLIEFTSKKCRITSLENSGEIRDCSWLQPEGGDDVRDIHWVSSSAVSSSGGWICVGLGASSPGRNWNGDWGELILMDLAGNGGQARHRVARPVTAICSFDRDSFVFGLGDGSVGLLPVNGDKPIGALIRHPAEIVALAAESVSGMIASASADGDVRVWKSTDEHEVCSTFVDSRPASIGFVDDSKQLWVGTGEGRVLKWELNWP